MKIKRVEKISITISEPDLVALGDLCLLFCDKNSEELEKLLGISPSKRSELLSVTSRFNESINKMYIKLREERP